MSKFNEVSSMPQVKNLAGGISLTRSPKTEFVTNLLTNFVKDQYYRSGEQSLDDLLNAARQLPYEFVAKGAVYARNEFGMRSVSHVLAVHILRNVKGEQWTKRFVSRVCRRVDDMTEIMALYLNQFGKPVPNSLKKGMKRAFNKFDGYQLAKYRAESKKVSLVDVVNLTHPHPAEGNKQAIQDLVEGKLRSKETWEAGLTQAGQSAENEPDKREKKRVVWASLLDTKRLGYFAILRNLRNIAEQAPESLAEALKQLTDAKSIEKSLVLPFRFMTAYTELQGLHNREIIEALDKALLLSLRNCPDMHGSCVAIDLSGSMVGEHFGGDPGSTAAMFGAVMYLKGADVIVYSGDAKYVTPPPMGVLGAAEKLYDSIEHGNTYTSQVFSVLDKRYDRIVMLTDEQAWVGHDRYNGTGTPEWKKFRDYCKLWGAHPHLYVIDLAGYGQTSFPESQTYLMAGFSEKIFEIMQLLETDREALINKIEAIRI